MLLTALCKPAHLLCIPPAHCAAQGAVLCCWLADQSLVIADIFEHALLESGVSTRHRKRHRLAKACLEATQVSSAATASAQAAALQTAEPDQPSNPKQTEPSPALPDDAAPQQPNEPVADFHAAVSTLLQQQAACRTDRQGGPCSICGTTSESSPLSAAAWCCILTHISKACT